MRLVFRSCILLLAVYIRLRSQLVLVGRLIYPSERHLRFIVNVTKNSDVIVYFYRLTLYFPRSKMVLVERTGQGKCRDGFLDISRNDILEEWKWIVIAEAARFRTSGNSIDIPWIFEYSVQPFKRVSFTFRAHEMVGFSTLIKHFYQHIRGECA